MLARVESVSQVGNSTSSVHDIMRGATVQYSNSNLNNLNNSNSTVTTKEVLSSISDLIHDSYQPYYAKQLRLLGYKRFIELANKARAGSDNPQKLFSWMLKNNTIVQ